MRRALVVIAVAATLAVGFVIWYVLRPPVSVFIVPDAADIEVINVGFGEQLITYRAPGAAYVWRTQLLDKLGEYGWTLPTYGHAETPSYDVTRISSFWFGTTLGWVVLDGEPNIARSSVRRWVKLPCILIGPSSSPPISSSTCCRGAWGAVGLDLSAIVRNPLCDGDW